jgi:hypothetical protein
MSGRDDPTGTGLSVTRGHHVETNGLAAAHLAHVGRHVACGSNQFPFVLPERPLMQICPHCAKPVEDFVRPCDHCGRVVLENSIDEALRDLDMKLTASMDLANTPMLDALSTATAQPFDSEAWLQGADPFVAAQPPDPELWSQLTVAAPPLDVEAQGQSADPAGASWPASEASSQCADPPVAAQSPDLEAWWRGVDPPVAAQPPDPEACWQGTDPPVAAQPPDAEACSRGVDPLGVAPPQDADACWQGADPPVAAQSSDAEAGSDGVDPLVAAQPPDAEAWWQGADPVAAQPPDAEAWPQGVDPHVPSPPAASEASSQGMHPAVAGSAWKSWPVAVTVAAAFAVGGVGIMMGRSSPPPTPPTGGLAGSSVPVAKVRVPQHPAAEVRVLQHPDGAVDPLRSPKWVRARQPGWATDGSKIVSFELEAENDVRVWMKHVRPVLAVRCLGRQTEVFVITDSAMSIEPTPDRHTVHVSFDGGAEAEERWLDSDAKKELFAPDGVALAHQLASARTMRFGFTPYSASPVVVDFDVHGFAGLLEPVARTCGWPSKAKAVSARSGG